MRETQRAVIKVTSSYTGLQQIFSWQIKISTTASLKAYLKWFNGKDSTNQETIKDRVYLQRTMPSCGQWQAEDNGKQRTMASWGQWLTWSSECTWEDPLQRTVSQTKRRLQQRTHDLPEGLRRGAGWPLGRGRYTVHRVVEVQRTNVDGRHVDEQLVSAVVDLGITAPQGVQRSLCAKRLYVGTAVTWK